MKKAAILTVLVFLSWSSSASSASNLINYQGRLTDSGGTPVTGSVPVVFSLYATASGGTPFWTERQTVEVLDGLYNTLLGSVTPLSAAHFDSPAVYLGVKIGADDEMEPRHPVTSVPYALRSAVAETVPDRSITPAKLTDDCAAGQVLVRAAAGWQCGSVAGFPNAVGTCAGDACTLICNAGWRDCDVFPTNGCETDSANDPNNCGSCSTACPSSPNATIACVQGRCAITACSSANLRDCDGDVANGCETDLFADPLHCGTCATICAAVPNASVGCVSGSCIVSGCASGYADCDRQYGNGCEDLLQTSLLNCGSCGNTCTAGQRCAGGNCVYDCPVLINEVFSGIPSTKHQYVELYNSCAVPITLSGAKLKTHAGAVLATLNAVLPSQGYYVVATPLYKTARGADAQFDSGVFLPPAAAGGVGLYDKNNQSVDSVGWGAASAVVEGSPAALPGTDAASLSRIPNGTDTADNARDFQHTNLSAGRANTSCRDGAKNGPESDVDCGGPGVCDRCADLKVCTAAGDCQSRVCTGNVCRPPTCSDRVKNGAETGTDCGGSCPECPPVNP